MKQSLRLSCLILLLFTSFPQVGYSASLKRQVNESVTAKNAPIADGGTAKRYSFREKIGRKVRKFKQKMQHWKAIVSMSLPSGKLLTSLILLLLSMVFFAIGGLTCLGVLFNLLGSAAVIAALIFFVLWLSGRTNAPIPTD